MTWIENVQRIARPRLYDFEHDDTEYEPPSQADLDQWAANEQADALHETGYDDE